MFATTLIGDLVVSDMGFIAHQHKKAILQQKKDPKTIPSICIKSEMNA